MGCRDCIHPSMPHHCSLDDNHRTQTSSCGGDSSKQQHLALWQTEQAVALVALELPLGLSQEKAADGEPAFPSPLHFSIFLTFWAPRDQLSSIRPPWPSLNLRNFSLSPVVLQEVSLSIGTPLLRKCKNRQAFRHWEH